MKVVIVQRYQFTLVSKNGRMVGPRVQELFNKKCPQTKLLVDRAN